MDTVIIDGIGYCVETPPAEDDGDNSKKPSSEGISSKN